MLNTSYHLNHTEKVNFILQQRYIYAHHNVSAFYNARMNTFNQNITLITQRKVNFILQQRYIYAHHNVSAFYNARMNTFNQNRIPSIHRTHSTCLLTRQHCKKMTPLIIIKLQATHLSVDLSGYNVANSHTSTIIMMTISIIIPLSA